MITAKVIADSISQEGRRITTMQLCYPRFIHAEFMTHRVFSRNASSSRAIPVPRMLEMVRKEPAMPIHWGKNQPGMQANEELSEKNKVVAKYLWELAAERAAEMAKQMVEIGLHKQVANRILEPFQHIHVVVTATEWDNFFELRAHPDAQPEIQALAYEIGDKREGSVPKLLQHGQWHLPYIQPYEFADYGDDIELLKKVSAARCCRVSYLKHDGSQASIEEDLALCEKLAGARPIHASPFEHQATPDRCDTVYLNSEKVGEAFECPELHGNFVGWIQYRKQIEQSFK